MTYQFAFNYRQIVFKNWECTSLYSCFKEERWFSVYSRSVWRRCAESLVHIYATIRPLFLLQYHGNINSARNSLTHSHLQETFWDNSIEKDFLILLWMLLINFLAKPLSLVHNSQLVINDIRKPCVMCAWYDRPVTWRELIYKDLFLPVRSD